MTPTPSATGRTVLSIVDKNGKEIGKYRTLERAKELVDDLNRTGDPDRRPYVALDGEGWRRA